MSNASSLPVQKTPRCRKKALPHAVRTVGGKHLPIVLGAIYNGLEVLWPAPADRGGNRCVYYQCFCGRAGHGRWSDLRLEKIKSCVCLSTAAHNSRHLRRLALISAENRREIFSLLEAKMSASDVARRFELEKTTVDFVRRSEYARLDALDPDMKSAIAFQAHRSMEETQRRTRMTHAEVMAVCILEKQRRLRELATTAASCSAILAILPVPPASSSQVLRGAAALMAPRMGARAVSPGTFFWNAQTPEYQEASRKLATDVWWCSQAISRDDAWSPISDDELLNPNDLKAWYPLEAILKGISAGTHTTFDGHSRRASWILDLSRARNRARMDRAMNEAALLKSDPTPERVAAHEASKARRAKRRKTLKVMPKLEEVVMGGVYHPNRAELASMVMMVDARATAS